MTSRIKAVAAALALSSIALIPGTADAATPGVWVNNGTCANVQTNIIDNDSSTLYARIALSTGTRLRDLSFKIRRIVTTHDAQGKAIVGTDTQIESKPGVKDKNVQGAVLWVTNGSPANISDPRDPIEGRIELSPGPGGSILRILELPPNTPALIGQGMAGLFAREGVSAEERARIEQAQARLKAPGAIVRLGRGHCSESHGGFNRH